MKYISCVHLALAVRSLRSGGVIAYPTEGVWGLGCDPLNPEAVRRLLAIKGRHEDKGLILIAANAEQFESYLRDLEPLVREDLLCSWPGPVTWVVPAAWDVPVWIRGQHPGVALRVSDHYLVKALCHEFGAPIVSTSANPRGYPPARSALTLHRYFRQRLDYVLSGRLGGRPGPSEIRDALTGMILRPG